MGEWIRAPSTHLHLVKKLQKKRKRTWKSDKRAENVINWNSLSEKIRDPEGLGAENQKRGPFKEEKVLKNYCDIDTKSYKLWS